MRKHIDVRQNWLDKAISAIDPVNGAKRFQARVALAMANAYIGGSKSRRSMKEWKTTSGDADSDILPDLETLRERSRDLVRNNPLAAGALKTKVTNVVGTGLRFQSSIDWEYLGLTEEQAEKWEKTTEREFRLWADSQYCDAEKTLNFSKLQALAFLNCLENGDVFIAMPYIPKGGFPYELSIQLIEADRVCNPKFAPDTPTLAGGVEKDEFGAPQTYHVLKQHPGSVRREQLEWLSLPAFGAITGRRNVLHLFHKLRPGQSRGVPDLAPVIEAFKQLGTYSEAEIMAAVVSAMFTVFIKGSNGQGLNPMPSSEGSQARANDKDYKMGPGAMLDLMEGEDVTFANPGRPNAMYEPFVKAVLEQIGVALELPFEVLTKHFTASYSAARAALIEAWKFFLSQRSWLASNFCQPVYEAWLTEAVALGRVYAPGFLTDPAIRAAYCRGQWIGPARGQINELDEMKAADLRVKMGLSSLEEESAELRGTNWENVHRQRVKEVTMRREAGLEIDPTQPLPEAEPQQASKRDLEDGQEQ